ncbi:hypothetical protein MRX96_003487 [Rhipicephalus microplus]
MRRISQSCASYTPLRILTSSSSTGMLVPSVASLTLSSSKSHHRGEEGWKEVVRRSKKVTVPSAAISRVIGRCGCNINAIRESSGAHIEVEKQKGQGERTILIRGSAEATKQAQLLIQSLVQEPERDLSDIMAQHGVAAPTPAKASTSSSDHRACSSTPANHTGSSSVLVSGSGGSSSNKLSRQGSSTKVVGVKAASAPAPSLPPFGQTPQLATQLQRLTQTPTGRDLLLRLGYISQFHDAARRKPIPDQFRATYKVAPIPRNMDPRLHQGRREARGDALERTYAHKNTTYYVDAANYVHANNKAVATVVDHTLTERTSASVRCRNITDAEEAAIALALGYRQRRSLTVLTDSQAACHNYLQGRISQPALNVIMSYPSYMVPATKRPRKEPAARGSSATPAPRQPTKRKEESSPSTYGKF